MDRRTRILCNLSRARECLNEAADWRARGCEAMALGVLRAARCYLAAARVLMAEAPASTRRRWKVQIEVNTRKRIARQWKGHSKPGYILPSGRAVYAGA